MILNTLRPKPPKRCVERRGAIVNFQIVNKLFTIANNRDLYPTIAENDRLTF